MVNGCGWRRVRGVHACPPICLRERLWRSRVGRMLERSRGRASGGTSGGFRRAVVAITGLGLVQMLSGCIFNSSAPPLGIEIPDRYRRRARADPAAAGARLVARLPLGRTHRTDRGSADRQFRHRRRDRAHHPGRRPEQDRRRAAAAGRRFRRQSRRARGRPAARTATTYRAALTASYEIDFWGKNRATSRAAQENAVATRFDRDTVAITDGRQRRHRLFPGAGRRRTACASRARTSQPRAAC